MGADRFEHYYDHNRGHSKLEPDFGHAVVLDSERHHRFFYGRKNAFAQFVFDERIYVQRPEGFGK